MRFLFPLILLIGSYGARQEITRSTASDEKPGGLLPGSAFVYVDVFVDSGEVALAAWQVDLRFVGEGIRIVGIEGGEREVFREAPSYDPRALQGERAVMAAFTVADPAGLQKGRARVARVHAMVPDGIAPGVIGVLEAAGDAAGQRIAAKVDWELRR